MKNKKISNWFILVRLFFALLAPLTAFVFSTSCHAEDVSADGIKAYDVLTLDAGEPFILSLGKSELIKLNREVTDVIVGSPGVVGTSLIKSDLLLVTPLRSGFTSIIALDRKNNTIVMDIRALVDPVISPEVEKKAEDKKAEEIKRADIKKDVEEVRVIGRLDGAIRKYDCETTFCEPAGRGSIKEGKSSSGGTTQSSSATSLRKLSNDYYEVVVPNTSSDAEISCALYDKDGKVLASDTSRTDNLATTVHIRYSGEDVQSADCVQN